jgi:hypothetical protein
MLGTQTDPQVSKMAALRAMLDAGSITEADFEGRKIARPDAMAPFPPRREADRQGSAQFLSGFNPPRLHF